jgi:hypothetical protein
VARQLPTYDPFKISSIDPLGLGLRVIGNNYDPLEDYNKVIQGQAEAAVNQEKIDGLRRADEIEKKIAESAKGGAGYEDILAQVEKEYLSSGDIDTAMKAAKMRESLAGDPMEEAKKLASLYKSAQEISAIDPAQGLAVLNSVRTKSGQAPLTSIPDQGELRSVPGVGLVRMKRDNSSYEVVIPELDKPKEPKGYKPGEYGNALVDLSMAGTNAGAVYNSLPPHLQRMFPQYRPQGAPAISETGQPRPLKRFITTEQAQALGYGPAKIAAMKQQGIIRDGF